MINICNNLLKKIANTLLKSKKIFITISCIVLSVLVGFSYWAIAQTNPPTSPDFELLTFDGEQLLLSDLRGDIVVLHFWASWCGPCRQEMPLMNDIYEEYKDLGFTILAVNVDEDSADADRFLKAVPVDFPVLYDSDSKISEMYQVDAMPTTVLIDRDGNKRFHHRGYKAGYEVEYSKQVKALVRE